jgi:hypothetical protein
MKANILAAALAVCVVGGNESPPPSPAIPPSPPGPGTVWSMNYGRPLGAVQMQAGDFFDFPVCAPDARGIIPCSIGYVERPWPPLTGKSLVTLSYTITGTNPVWSYKTNPNNNCGDGTGGTLSLFLHRAGDNLFYPYHRWFSNPSHKSLYIGEVIYTVPLVVSEWVSVFGQQSPAEFDIALQNIASIGFVFGGGCFAGHGVALTSGSARFTINSLTAQ